jgi:hypothetical protein
MRSVVATATAAAVLAVLAVSLGACSGAAGAAGERTVTVNHPAAPAPTYVDLGDKGASAGDVRLFSFAGTSGSETVHVETIMTTTGIVDGTTDEYRDTRLIVTFASPADQLILEGVAVYPGANSVIKPATTVNRPVIGGSGAYAGATGWCDSTHNADGTWTHVFHIH